MSAYELQIGLFSALERSSEPTLSADFINQEYSISTARLENALFYLRENVKGIYDNPTQVADPSDDTAFPFITLSDGTASPWDTDTERGDDATVVVHVWSRASHSLESKQIQGAIYNVLHRGTISITGSVFVGCDYLSQTVQRDPDGITRHGVQEFRIVYEEA